jgi:hypothetical protein
MLVPLDPGEWTLELHRAGALRASRIVDIQPDQPPFHLADRLPPPKPAPAPSTTSVTRASPSLGGVAGGLTTIVGTSIIVVTQPRAAQLHDTLVNTRPSARRPHAPRPSPRP